MDHHLFPTDSHVMNYTSTKYMRLSLCKHGGHWHGYMCQSLMPYLSPGPDLCICEPCVTWGMQWSDCFCALGWRVRPEAQHTFGKNAVRAR